MEIWKPIARFDGVIEASNLGGVRRIATLVNCRNGYKRLAPARVFKARRHPWGYEWFEFSIANKKHWDFGHRLVMEAFFGPCPDGMYVLHFDNDQSNNNVNNLRYGTPSDNCRDKLMHGTQPAGEQIPWHKLKESQVVEMRCRRAAGEKLADIAVNFGISEVYVWHICTGAKWSNAGGPIESKTRNVKILDGATRAEVLKLRKDGLSIRKLAVRFGVSNTQIHNIIVGERHEDKKR